MLVWLALIGAGAYGCVTVYRAVARVLSAARVGVTGAPPRALLPQSPTVAPRSARPATRASGMPSLRRTDGQAAAELVAMLPLAALLLAGAWQLVVAGHAAWAAAALLARAPAQRRSAPTPSAAARAPLSAGLRRDPVVRERGSGTVEVTVRIPPVLGLQVLGHASAPRALPPAGMTGPRHPLRARSGARLRSSSSRCCRSRSSSGSRSWRCSPRGRRRATPPQPPRPVRWR